MSFTGDLEHLPIVDVIQLLHSSRKSGTLTVRCRKGESQLVFKDGYIVCANHPNTTVRIGKLLLEAQAITEEDLDKALLKQWHAEEDRKPLIATLIEGGVLKKEDAYRGLATLIEMTVVEILTWTKGTFSLDVERNIVSDEYRYFPEKLHQEMNLDTQSVLMDALRIYDERMRDGQLENDQYEGSAEPAEQAILTADDLGLADLDMLEKKIPAVFSGLNEQQRPPLQQQGVALLATDLTAAEQEQLSSFLAANFAAPTTPRRERPARAIILFSPDPLLCHTVTTVCAKVGLLVFATTDQQDLEPIINQYLARQCVPLLLLDRPDDARGFDEEELGRLRSQKRQKYSQIPIVQLTPPRDFSLMGRAFADGVRAVLPRPARAEYPDSFVNEFSQFLKAVGACLTACSSETGASARLNSRLSALQGLSEVPEVALALLKSVADHFPRALTLVVRPTELIAERGLGVQGAGAGEPTPPLGFKIPLGGQSVFGKVIETGEPFYGPCADALLLEQLHGTIGAPRESVILLLPLRTRDQTISLTYADFGPGEPSPVDLEELATVARFAGLMVENALYRKRLGKSSI